MSDYFEPAVRRDLSGLDWNVFLTEPDDETDETEEPSTAQVSEDGSVPDERHTQDDMT